MKVCCLGHGMERVRCARYATNLPLWMHDTPQFFETNGGLRGNGEFNQSKQVCEKTDPVGWTKNESAKLYWKILLSRVYAMTNKQRYQGLVLSMYVPIHKYYISFHH